MCVCVEKDDMSITTTSLQANIWLQKNIEVERKYFILGPTIYLKAGACGWLQKVTYN